MYAMPDTNDIRPMTPRQATEALRARVGPDLDLSLTRHAKEQMAERGLIIGDVVHVLRNGFVYEEAQPATRPGYFKYRMECKTPNSGGRTVRIVVIPAPSREIKLVAVMWKDE